MKKLLGLTILAAALMAFVSCASTKAADAEPEAPAVSAAKEAALAEEGAIDLSTWYTIDSWAVKYDDAAYTVTMNGGEYIQWPLPTEVAPGSTVKVHLTGTNNGASGFRSWLVDNNQGTNSNLYLDCAFDALAQGDFDVTYELTATNPGDNIFIKGPQYGTMIEKLTIKSVAVIYE